ncbi:MAG: 16S rRNA processing protein RimM [Candidatus Schekmanbacteria bacterium]|nr:MAG: 16S rRNA processing protein RimM [Candidatus Schekmanbacteria bacterium]
MSNSTNIERILIGIIKKPRGKNGEVTVVPLTLYPERFHNLDSVYLEYKDGNRQEVKIESVRFHKDKVILKFQKIDTSKEAWELENAEITIDPSEIINLPEGYYFEHDIYECDVFDEKGNFLGKIHSIIKTPGNDVFVIKSAKKELLIPALDNFIKKIDIEKKIITVIKPEYI